MQELISGFIVEITEKFMMLKDDSLCQLKIFSLSSLINET